MTRTGVSGTVIGVRHDAAVGAATRGAARDAELVARVRAGDRAAETQLYRAHVAAAAALAMRLLGRTGDAEDVVQDAFVTAFARMNQLRDGALFGAWLMRITVHEVHRRFRKRKLMRALGLDRGEDDATLARFAAPHLDADQRAQLIALDRVLSRMPVRERVAWMLRYVEGQELAEIASACEASLATIKRWLARADARVREGAGRVAEEGGHD